MVEKNVVDAVVSARNRVCVEDSTNIVVVSPAWKSGNEIQIDLFTVIAGKDNAVGDSNEIEVCRAGQSLEVIVRPARINHSMDQVQHPLMVALSFGPVTLPDSVVEEQQNSPGTISFLEPTLLCAQPITDNIIPNAKTYDLPLWWTGNAPEVVPDSSSFALNIQVFIPQLADSETSESHGRHILTEGSDAKIIIVDP